MHIRTFVIYILFLFPLMSIAQSAADRGIRFENDATWQQVKEKAKREGKFIFVDCYATWCMPCKAMDKNVYTSEAVGNVANTYFVSVKVQMDSTARDVDLIKQWFPVAHSFKVKFNMAAFPTYLFFSPDGEIVHSASGYKQPHEFVNVLSEAIDPKRQLYTQLDRYKRGIKDFETMPALAKNVYALLQDKDLAYTIANDYKKNHLNKLKKDELLKKENIEFITWYPKLLKSTDKYFLLIYKNGNRVDRIMNQPGFASGVVDGVILRDVINPQLYKNGKAVVEQLDWMRLTASVSKKFGRDLAERNVLNAQIAWYTRQKDWDKAIDYEVKRIEKVGIDTTFVGRVMLNNFCYDKAFKYSNNTTVLNKAIKWMETILAFEPDDASGIDTYANLLYKIGRTAEAIKWQEKAVQLDPGSESLSTTLQKMRNNEPTWPTAR